VNDAPDGQQLLMLYRRLNQVKQRDFLFEALLGWHVVNREHLAWFVLNDEVLQPELHVDEAPSRHVF
jgi:hypothetical protein